MKKILFGMFSALLVIGGGCINQTVDSSSTIQDQKQVVEQKTYTNSKWNYSFSYPSSTMRVSEIDLDNVRVSYIRPENREGGYSPSLEIKIIKTTVYPESKIELLKKEYFEGNKNVKVTQLKAGARSGWEMVNETHGGIGENYKVLYFPLAEKELITVDSESAFDNLLATFQFTK